MTTSSRDKAWTVVSPFLLLDNQNWDRQRFAGAFRHGVLPVISLTTNATFGTGHFGKEPYLFHK